MRVPHAKSLTHSIAAFAPLIRDPLAGGVPSQIALIKINIVLFSSETDRDVSFPVDSFVSTDNAISGDADIFTEDGKYAIVEMQGIRVIPLTPAQPGSDSRIFFEFV